MSTRFILLAVAAVLVVPSAAVAAWSGKGGFEPSTGLDLDGFMFTTPDQANDGVRRVYFSGFAGAATNVAVTSVNPNLGAAQTSIIQPANFNAQALLGVWKDCNKDGYIGFGDNALFEYRVELLRAPIGPGESVCPPVPLADANPATPAFDFPQHTGILQHNDGEWVREFIPIGPETTAPHLPNDQNPFNIPDSGARVWADWGEPGAAPGYICYLTAHPTGSFDTFGSMIGLADCYGRQRIDNSIQGVTNGNPTLDAAYDQLKATPNPWGKPSDDPAVVVADCSSPILAPVKVPGTQHVVGVPRPTPGPGSGTSVGGTVNATSNAFTDCDRGNGAPASADSLPYSTTQEINNQYGRKTVNEWVLKFTEDVRPGPTSAATNALGRGATKDLGTRVLMEGFWRANAISLIGRNPLLSIDDVTPQRVQPITYYATVSSAAASAYSLRFPGTTGVYGAEACGSNIGAGQPDRNAWACDPEAWWPTNLQQDVIAQGLVDGKSTFVGVKLGQRYQLRDVDCYDTSAGVLRENGIYYLPTNLPCN